MTNLNSGSDRSHKCTPNSANKHNNNKSSSKCDNITNNKHKNSNSNATSSKNKRRLLSRRQRRQLQQLKQTHGLDAKTSKTKTNLMNFSLTNNNNSTNKINSIKANTSSSKTSNNLTSSLKIKFGDTDQPITSSMCGEGDGNGGNFKRKRLSSTQNINNIELDQTWVMPIKIDSFKFANA